MLVFFGFPFLSSSFLFQTLISDCCFKKSQEVNAFLKVSCSLVFKLRNCFFNSGQEVGMNSDEVSPLYGENGSNSRNMIGTDDKISNI